MEKRWLAFFLIFAATFLVFSMREAAKRSDRLEEERLLQIRNATHNAALPPEATAADDTTSSTVRIADATQHPRTEISLAESPTEVVDNGFVRVEFAQVGAVPVSWQVLPSKYMTGIFDDIKGTTTTLDLIPQVARTSEREYPLQFEGKALDAFNGEKYDVTREVTKGGDSIVTFTSPVVDDMQVVRRYEFPPDSYLVKLDIEVRNGAARSPIGDAERGWGLGWQGGFGQPHVMQRADRPTTMMAAVADEVRFKSLNADDEAVNYDRHVFWGGQGNKYFTALVMPGPKDQPSRVEMAVRKRNISDEYLPKGVRPPQSISLLNDSRELKPNEIMKVSYTLFVGPKEYNLMRKLKVAMVAGAPPPSEVVFGQIFWGKSWIRPISLLLLKCLHWLADHLKNWGLAIIALVLIVKTILLPLSQWAIKNQARTMAEQGRIKPFLDKINERYKNDPSKRSQEMMKLYREHNINPLGMLRGCFPVLLQMPIFIALYVVLGEAIELRGQNFLWMRDLSGPDRLIHLPFTIPFLGWDAVNILPFFMAFTQYLSSKMMSSNITDPTQKQVMVMMPIVFTIFMYNFPSGLMVYWVVQNVWTIAHTALTKRYVATHDSGAPGGTKTASAPA